MAQCGLQIALGISPASRWRHRRHSTMWSRFLRRHKRGLWRINPVTVPSRADGDRFPPTRSGLSMAAVPQRPIRCQHRARPFESTPAAPAHSNAANDVRKFGRAPKTRPRVGVTFQMGSVGCSFLPWEQCVVALWTLKDTLGKNQWTNQSNSCWCRQIRLVISRPARSYTRRHQKIADRTRAGL